MTNTSPLCKGSIVLGTGCKRCERCVREIAELGDPTSPKTISVIAAAEHAFRHLFEWIKQGAPVYDKPCRWARGGFTAEHMTQSPAGEFYLIVKHDQGLTAYLRPDAAPCLGWMKRIDLRGEGTLHTLHTLARVDPPVDAMFEEVEGTVMVPITMKLAGTLWNICTRTHHDDVAAQLQRAIEIIDPTAAFSRPRFPAPTVGSMWLAPNGEGRLVMAIVPADPEPLVFYRGKLQPDVLISLRDWTKWVEGYGATERTPRGFDV